MMLEKKKKNNSNGLAINYQKAIKWKKKGIKVIIGKNFFFFLVITSIGRRSDPNKSLRHRSYRQ